LQSQPGMRYPIFSVFDRRITNLNGTTGPFCWQMLGDNQRESDRINCDARVIIEDFKSGDLYEGSMFNYSRGGMYVELDFPIQPGSKLRISAEREKSSFRPESCLANVIWCNEVPGAVVMYNYGVGVQCDLPFKPLKLIDSFKVIEGGAGKDNSLGST